MRGSGFFEGVRQEDMVFAGQTGKLPLFYYDGTAMTAAFPARYRELKRLMPDPRYVPARVAPGVGAVGITAFEYRDTDIGPYNELAIAILMNDPRHTLNIPGRALLSGYLRGQMHAYIHHLPVTTDAALVGGVDFYNYPKFIGRIDFSEEGNRRECRLAEGEERILTLTGDKIPTPRSQRLRVFSHLYMNHLPQSSEFELNLPNLGVSLRPQSAKLELGDRHPIALELKKLLFRLQPIQYQYMPDFEGILHGPDRLTLPLLRRIEEARREAELAG